MSLPPQRSSGPSRPWRGFAKVILGCLLLGAAPGPATRAADDPQNKPDEAAPFFGLDKLWTIHLKVPEKSWDMMEPRRPDRQRPAGPNAPDRPPGRGDGRGLAPGPSGIDFAAAPATVEWEGRTLENVALRFKGNSSFRTVRDSPKRSFKIDFNDYVKGQRLLGLTKLNLNNNAMDASQMAEALAYEVFRQAGVPAPRTAFARVFLTVPGRQDHQYLGLYTVVEQVDERFTEDRLGTTKGLLVKPESPQPLPYLGPDWSAYRQTYETKTKVTPEEAEQVIALARLTHEADNATFRGQFADLVDLDNFLRYLAVNSVLANLDSPLATGHNYYLHLHPVSHKFTWIPWDLNHAFGTFPAVGSPDQQMRLSIQHPFVGENRLVERVLAVPEWSQAYRGHVEQLLATAIQPEPMSARIDAVARLIRPAVAEESPSSLERFDQGVAHPAPSAESKLESPRASPARPVVTGRRTLPPMRPHALKPWIAGRVESVKAQLEGKAEGEVLQHRRLGPAPRPPDEGRP